MALVQAKKELRQRMRQILTVVAPESIARQTTSSLGALFSLPEYQHAAAISVYLSMPSGEISTRDIIHDAFQNGKKVFVPYTYKLPTTREFWPTSIMDMVQLESLQDYESLKPDSWGIPTPSAETIGRRSNCFGQVGRTNGELQTDVAGEGLDIVIMPGMVFDRTLERLGHGKGYYDFFLQRYLWHSQKVKQKMPFLVGLALNEQLLPFDESVPTDATDYRLDALVLGNGDVLRSDFNPTASFETDKNGRTPRRLS